MFKKVLSYILIVFGLAALYASTSPAAMKYISVKRDVDTWWGSYQNTHGDLTGMSYLDLVKKFDPPRDLSPITPPAYSGAKNTVLYIHGDSYAYHLQDTFFAGLYGFHTINRIADYQYHLDTTKRNILIIEVSERYLRSYFNDLRMFDHFSDTTKKRSISQTETGLPPHVQYAAFSPNIHLDDLFNKYINQNLQFNLFNYNFIRPVFEYKAALSYYLFNRASGDVVISDNGNFLLLKETVTGADIGSSYIPVTGADITRLVDNFNAIYDHYKKDGFREVYLSVIPSATTIVQPEGYNGLIPALQNDPHLRIKIIDVYSMFKNSKEQLLLPNDTHWNRQGLRKWIGLVNEKLVAETSVK